MVQKAYSMRSIGACTIPKLFISFFGTCMVTLFTSNMLQAAPLNRHHHLSYLACSRFKIRVFFFTKHGSIFLSLNNSSDFIESASLTFFHCYLRYYCRILKWCDVYKSHSMWSIFFYFNLFAFHFFVRSFVLLCMVPLCELKIIMIHVALQNQFQKVLELRVNIFPHFRSIIYLQHGHKNVSTISKHIVV